MTERASRRVENPPTGTVTFLFTDIESSTAMWERDPVRMQDALARHDEILRTSVEASGGYVFKTVGDAFCAAFTTARDALEATLAAQRALFVEKWNENTTVRVRMALHTGGPMEERDGDYFGQPVNRVARLLSAGHGGQVLLSGVTYGLVRDTLSSSEPGAELRDLGEHRLKDLKHSERIYQIVVPDLPSEFPFLKTLDTRSDERYGLSRLVGSGKISEVYLAHDKELDRDVALKVLKNQYASDEQFVEQFKSEAKNAASLSHPNIVQVFDRGKMNDGAYYMAMERVSGATLKERLREEGPLPAPETEDLALQVAQALRVAHERGVIHRDIRPQNILLTESGDAKVADFGIARAVASSTMTRTGFFMGTPHYISPEQALGQPASPRSDLYSLGVVLYEMLTGEVPHDAETPIGVAMKHVSGDLHPPKEANPEVPEGIDAVTVKLLARDPEERYHSAAELVEDLERVRQGEPPANALADPSVTSDSPTGPSSPKRAAVGDGESSEEDRYRRVRPIGGGGMAEVYLAHDEVLDRDVALKVLRKQYADDEQFVERFKREAKNAASLSHPNIVAVHDRGETSDGAYYIVMEYVSGGTLKERILKEGPLGATEAGAWALQVARALRVAHERGVIHRDIKPQNVLLTESGEAKVGDFGIARAASSTVLTQEGSVLGTTHYISPEQALGQPASPRSDLYSLGVVLYEMLTGEVPHDAETPVGIAMKHLGGLLRPPKEANPEVPEEMNAVAVRLLARDPEERYGSAAELIEDLELIGRGQSPKALTAAPRQDESPVEETPVPPRQEPAEAPPGPPPVYPGGDGTGDGQPRWRGRIPFLAAGLLGVLLLLGAGVFFLAGQFSSTALPGYRQVEDDSGRLSVEVPDEWSEVDGTTWDFRGGKIGQSIIATTDLETWYRHNYYHDSSEGIDETPGVLFGVSRSLINQYPEDTEDQVLSLPEYDYTGTCEYDERDDYDDGIYTGRSDHWTNCGETNAEVYVHVLLPEDRSQVVVIQVTAGSEADLEAQKHVLDTFKIADDS